MKTRGLVLLTLLAAAPAHADLSPHVVGYTDGYAPLDGFAWQNLSEVVFYAESLRGDGSLSTAGWEGPAGQGLIASAHGSAVFCWLAVTLSGPETHTLLTSPAAVTAATQAIAHAVAFNGGDGVALHVSGVAPADEARLSAFVLALRTAMPERRLAVAVPAAPTPGYDVTTLGATADFILLAALDIHDADSDPGPIAPLADSPRWGSGSQASAIALAEQKADPAKIIVGLPLYGYEYYVTSSALPGTKVPGSTAERLALPQAQLSAAQYGRAWDIPSATPFYQYVDALGRERQGFYEDTVSIGFKIDRVLNAKAGGIYLWRLGEPAPDGTPWGAIYQRIHREGMPPVPGPVDNIGNDQVVCTVAVGRPGRGLGGLALLVAVALPLLRKSRRFRPPCATRGT